MEMFVHSLEPQTVSLGELGFSVEFDRGRNAAHRDLDEVHARRGRGRARGHRASGSRPGGRTRRATWGSASRSRRNTRSRRASSSSASKSARMLPRSPRGLDRPRRLARRRASGQRFSATAASRPRATHGLEGPDRGPGGAEPRGDRAVDVLEGADSRIDERVGLAQQCVLEPVDDEARHVDPDNHGRLAELLHPSPQGLQGLGGGARAATISTTWTAPAG